MANNKVVPMRFCNGHNSILKCIGNVKEDEFYTSWSKFSDGKIRYCKKCVQGIYQYYLEETQSDKTALYYTLQKIDIPFIKEVFDIVYDKAIKQNKSLTINNYLTEFYKHNINKDIWSDFSCSDITINELNESKIKSVENKKEELSRLEKIWGMQENESDYDFLEETYNRYMENFDDELSPQQQDLLRDVCRDRLLLRKINSNEYNGEENLDKVQKRLSTLLSTLKLDNFGGNQKKTLSELSFIEKIMTIETMKPADLYKEPNKYRDFTHRGKYYRDLVLRPLLNTLCGSKDFSLNVDDFNKYNQYCDEMDKMYEQE